MRFRIMTDGRNWKVEKKTFWGWSVLQKYTGYIYELKETRVFGSDAEAAVHIREHYGTEAKIERPWVYSLPANTDVLNLRDRVNIVEDSLASRIYNLEKKLKMRS